MTPEPSQADALRGVELSRREVIRRLVVGTAFAAPVVASFDMALSVPAAEAYGPNQTVPIPPAITSAAALTLVAGVAGPPFTITTTGSPVPSLAHTGQLPTGVSLTDNGDGTATIAGAPSSSSGGVYTIAIVASNGGPPPASQAFTLTVNQGPLFTSAASANLSAGHAGELVITASAYPPATIKQSGPLPAGMSFMAGPGDGTALIAGEPAFNAVGVYRVALQATNGIASDASQTLTLIVSASPGTPSNRFTVSSIKVSPKDVVAVAVAVPGPGSVDVNVTASHRRSAFVVGQATVDAKGNGVVAISVKPSASVRRRLRAAGHGSQLVVSVTFTPVGGSPSTQTVKGIGLA